MIYEIHIEDTGTAKKFQETSVRQNKTWIHNGNGNKGTEKEKR